jgi:hypothetical protein
MDRRHPGGFITALTVHRHPGTVRAPNASDDT